MVDFSGSKMPIHYQERILKEHLDIRRYVALFDTGHMERIHVSGIDIMLFLQNVLSNDVESEGSWEVY